MNRFFKKRVVQPVLNLLKQGMTPQKLGATIAVGTMAGIVPAFGITTILATALAAKFKLNIAATVLISYLVQPLQLLLIIPYIKLGIFLFGLEELQFTFYEMQVLFKTDWLHALNQLWKANLAGVAAWVIVSVPVGWIMYKSLVPLLKNVLPVPVFSEPLVEESVETED